MNDIIQHKMHFALNILLDVGSFYSGYHAVS